MDNLRADSNGSFLQQGINRTGILVASSSAKRQKLYRLLPLSDSSLGCNVVFWLKQKLYPALLRSLSCSSQHPLKKTFSEIGIF